VLPRQRLGRAVASEAAGLELPAAGDEKGMQRVRDTEARLRAAHGIFVPGGFGDRGIEGKILTATYCRTSNTPYLGIAVGLQTAVIEFARSDLAWESANSTEYDEGTPHPGIGSAHGSKGCAKSPVDCAAKLPGG